MPKLTRREMLEVSIPVMLLLIFLLVASLIISAIFGFFGLAGWSATEVQCPYGSDCADATMAAWIGISVALVCLVISALIVWRLARALNDASGEGSNSN
jgi:uncharacterized membrane protein YtjA (UPF0391 family)